MCHKCNSSLSHRNLTSPLTPRKIQLRHTKMLCIWLCSATQNLPLFSNFALFMVNRDENEKKCTLLVTAQNINEQL